MPEPPPFDTPPAAQFPVPPVGAPIRSAGSIVRWLEPFLKLPIAPPKIPDGAADARVFRAAPAFLRYRYTQLAFVSLVELHVVIALIAGAFAAHVLMGIAATVLSIAVAAAILLIAYAAIRLDYDLRQYVVTDRAIRTRTGALTVSEATITFANVQNIEISQGPLQRWFGIADVLVHTAGGGGTKHKDSGGPGQTHRGAFVGIDRPQDVCDYVLERVRAFRDAGLGDPDDPTHRHAAGSSQSLDEALTELAAAAAEFRGAAASFAGGA